MSNKDYKVLYLRDKDYNPVGCVALRLTRTRKSVKYQLSVLNPVDRFDRKLSRQIALGRLVDQPINLVGLDGTEDNMQVTSCIMNDILSDKNMPTRARKAASAWLKKFYP